MTESDFLLFSRINCYDQDKEVIFSQIQLLSSFRIITSLNQPRITSPGFNVWYSFTGESESGALPNMP
uniref:Uncharacterized protein n=1 Tax=Arundo donax TaxID=35708 RepID=A0A0A9HLV4_ARUDO